MNITVRTARRSNSSGTDVSNLWPGLSVVPLTDDVRQQLSVNARTSGVVVAGVTTDSAAANSGLRQGDIITAVNGTRITSASDFYDVINGDVNELQFRVARGNTEIILGFVKPAA
jgi:serine protease Do